MPETPLPPSSPAGLLLGLAGLIAFFAAATAFLGWLERRRSPAARAVRLVRGVGSLVWLALLVAFALGLTTSSVTVEVLITAAWIVGVYAALTLLRAWVLPTGGPAGPGAAPDWRDRVPKLFVDLATLLLLLVGSGVVVTTVWGGDLGAIAAALGVGSIVVGLALQGTLSNLFAGIALLSERPYRVGDWVEVEGRLGQVVEVNWRAVRLRTRDNGLLVVPNAVVAGAVIQNHTRPTAVHAERLLFGFSYDDPPNLAKLVLRQAAAATRGVLREPAPTVRTVSYDDSSVGYEVRLYTDDFAGLPDILDRYTTRIWYAARRNGLSIPFPIRTVHNMKVDPPPPRPAPDAVALLRRVPIFSALEGSELADLADAVQTREYGRDEPVVRQGEAGDALYVVAKGEASVRVNAGGAPTAHPLLDREVSRLRAGEFFGEMSLLTGESRSASVLAASDLTTLVILTDDVATLLERRPALAEAMAAVAAERTAALAAAGGEAEAPAAVAAEKDRVLRGIRRFFGL